LIESSGIWFLKGMLRSHGYDHTTLATIVARPVTPTSWRVGDIVTHKSTLHQTTSKKLSPESPACSSMIGRIVVETSGTASSSAAHGRQNNSVAVEFVNRAFADAVGVKPANLPALSHETRRVKTHKLVHTTEIHGSRLRIQRSRNDEDDQDSTLNTSKESIENTELFSSAINEKVVLDIEATRRLDRSAIDSLAKQCRKSSDALASMFSAGLPDAIMAAISAADTQMNSLEPKDDLPDNIAALSNLVNALTERLFGKSSQSQETEEIDTELTSVHKSMPWQNAPRNLQNREQLRSKIKDAAQGESSRVGERNDDTQVFSSSLQQRHNMLLSLMSRASRSDNNDPTAESVIEPFGHIPPSRMQVRSASPYILGASSDLLEYEEQVRNFSEGQGESVDPFTLDNSGLSRDVVQSSIVDKVLLDSVLRCYGSISSLSLASGTTRQGGAAFALFVRHLIRCGVLFDSPQWTEALIVGYYKSFQSGAQAKVNTILRGVVDEEGTPVLVLAIVLGCSVDLISQLIKYGAPVGNEAIIKAAMTNQPRTLSLLLQHSSYEDGIINLESCTSAISRLLFLTKSRQDELSKRMEDETGDFMVRLLCKLFEVGLASRRIRNAQIDKCSKVICEMLIGNVLLRALQMNQKSVLFTSQGEEGKKLDASEKNDHTKENGTDCTHFSQGILGALPQFIFRDFLFRDIGNITKFLSLCEDYLCSKDMADVASGLSFLSLTLAKHPQLKSSSEMERFGVSEFVSNHNVLSSNRIADILSKELNIGLDVSKNASTSKDETRRTSCPKSNGIGVVLCPKKHTASLHVTRHSSFRCDICGSAVPKGEYIFGCRECDYDECLHCTLRDEKRILSVHMMIRALASECYRVLSDADPEKSCGKSVPNDELKSLSLRLLQQDVYAMKDLGIYLIIPGRITIHEFLTIILPSLHASMVGQSMKSDGLLSHSVTSHRNKKARASRGTSYESPEGHIKYCREALRHIVSIRGESSKLLGAKLEPSFNIFSADNENEIAEEDNGEKLDITYSPGASEILRRLHQILSFYENVQVIKTYAENSAGHNSPGNHDDMHDLTKPLELLLSSSSHDVSGSNSSRNQSVIYAEPLIPFSELQLHVLRAYRINDPIYITFCQR
jgi:hypothetical protein